MIELDFEKLDKIDLNIIRELQVNARLTYRELSESVSLSPSACVARVKRLENIGVIKGYLTSINLDLISSYVMMIAEISLSSHNIEDIDRLDKFLLESKEVIEVLRVNGTYDYIVKIVVAGMKDWHAFAKRLLVPSNMVSKMITNVVMEQLKIFENFHI